MDKTAWNWRHCIISLVPESHRILTCQGLRLSGGHRGGASCPGECSGHPGQPCGDKCATKHMTSIRHSQTRSEDHHPLIVLIICRQAPHHLVKVLWFPSSKLKGFTNRFADDSLLLLISSLPCGVQFVPGWLTGLAPHVAGGQVQHPGLGVHHLEGVRVHLIDPVARTKARVASNAIQWSIFRDKLTLKQILPRGNKPHPRGPGGVIRVIMKREVVVVSVAVELASDALLKPDESSVQVSPCPASPTSRWSWSTPCPRRPDTLRCRAARGSRCAPSPRPPPPPGAAQSARPACCL